MAAVRETMATKRLQRIVAAVRPCPVDVVSGLSAAACVAQTRSLAEMEGQAIARAAGYKVAMFCVGDRGVPLAARSSVEQSFVRRSLQVSWVNSVEELASDVDVIVTTGTPVGAEVLAKCTKLALVAVAFTGTDHVDVHACRARGVTVINTPAYSTDSAAQLAIALVLSHLHRLPACYETLQAGTWTCPQQEDLESKKVGIIGTGNLGVRCAELFSAFKVKEIIGYDQKQTSTFTDLGGKYAETLAALLLDADVVVVCLPLTDQTRGLISARLLELLRPDSLLVNIGRGAVVDETAMATLLKERRFRAALDVFGTEPLPADHPLRTAPSDVLLMTPHVGYQSTTSLEKRFDLTVKNILAYLAGQAIHVVRA